MRQILIGLCVVLIVCTVVLTGSQSLPTLAQAQPSSCEGAPPTQLAVGVRAAVLPIAASVSADPVRLRLEAGLKGRILTEMIGGTQMTVIGGPICKDSYLWWQIQLDNQAQGWAAEGEAKNYYLDPLPGLKVSCPNTPPSRFIVGAWGQVDPARPGAVPNVARIREAASATSRVVFNLPENVRFSVTGGPTCAEGYLWWKVVVEGQAAGWLAEGDLTRGYYVYPIGYPRQQRVVPSSVMTPTPFPLPNNVVGVTDIGVSADGSKVLGIYWDGKAPAWDVLSGAIQWSLPVEPRIVTLAVSPDGSHFATTGTDGNIVIWDFKTAKPLSSFVDVAKPDTVYEIRYSPDGVRLAVDHADGTTHLYDTQTGKLLHVFREGERTTIAGLAFSPDGRYLVTSGSDFMIRIWDTQSGDLDKQLKGHTDFVCGLDWSPDGQVIVSASLDRTIKVWDPKTGKVVRQFVRTNPSTASTTLAISHDSKTVAVGHADSIVRVWTLETGVESADMVGQFEPVFSIKYAPDDKTLFTAGFDGTARQWEVATGKQIKVFAHP